MFSGEKSGFTLLEVLFALAIGMIGLMGLSEVLNTSQKSQRGIASSIEFDQMGQLIRALTDQPANCAALLQNQPTNAQMSISSTLIQTSMGNVLAAGSRFGEWNITSVALDPPVVAAPGANLQSWLKIKARKIASASQSFGSPEKESRILFTGTMGAANTIGNCATIAPGQLSFFPSSVNATPYTDWNGNLNSWTDVENPVLTNAKEAYVRIRCNQTMVFVSPTASPELTTNTNSELIAAGYEPVCNAYSNNAQEDETVILPVFNGKIKTIVNKCTSGDCGGAQADFKIQAVRY